jgi:hypothetical protein
MIKIGILCGIGPLDKYGYQYHFQTVLKSFSNFADKVFLSSSTRLNHSRDNITSYKNVELVSNINTWLGLNDQGEEIFSINDSVRAVNHGLERMREEGYDIAINLCINQYIPPNAILHLNRVSEDIIKSNHAYAWLYKRYFLAGKLFHSDIRLPWIINLKHEPHLFSAPDSLVNATGNVVGSIETGDYRNYNDKAIVDIQFELTKKDLEEKVNFIRNYSDLQASKGKIVSPYFDEKTHFAAYQSKLNKKSVSADTLDHYGLSILSNIKETFISHDFMANYKPPSIPRRVYRHLQALKSTVHDYIYSIK